MGKAYAGNSSNKSIVPSKVYIGDNSDKSVTVKKIYMGDSNDKSVLVWPPLIPAAYQQVEYIQNSNLATYISTGITRIDNYTAMHFDLMVTSWQNTGESQTLSPISYVVIGESTVEAYVKRYGVASPTSGSFRFNVPNGSGDGSITVANVSYSLNTRYKIDFNVDGGYFYVDNVLKGNTTTTYEYTGLPSFPLFGLSTRNGFYYGYNKQRLYHYTATQGSTLIRDMYPCYRKSDSVVGMYDIVNDVFYGPSGSGTFYKGPNV